MSVAEVGRELFLRLLLPASLGGDSPARIAAAMVEVRLGAGDVLFRQGDVADAAYFVMEGEVVMEAEGVSPWILGERGVVGALDIMCDRARGRTAKATRPTTLLRVRASAWLDQLEDSFEFAFGTMRGVAERLHELHLQVAVRSPGSVFVSPTPGEPQAARPFDMVERVLTLSEAPVFRRASVQTLATLAMVMGAEEYAAGAHVPLMEGDEPTVMVVVRGEVELFRETPLVSARFGRATLVGGPAALTSALGAYAGRAPVDTLLLRASAEDFADAAEEHFDLVRSVLAHWSLERERLMEHVAAPPP